MVGFSEKPGSLRMTESGRGRRGAVVVSWLVLEKNLDLLHEHPREGLDVLQEHVVGCSMVVDASSEEEDGLLHILDAIA